MSNTLQYTFEQLPAGLEDILVAELTEAGFAGFESIENGMHAFVPEADLNKELFAGILNRYQLQPAEQVIPEQNWNAAWESSFDPVQVDDFCVIRAHFHQPVAGVRYDIVITPKMSFGTGHHATTYMMIDAMRGIDFTGKTVCDFGTGTGILAILAQKLGAAHITALDNDDWSIENAAENVANNHGAAIELKKAFVLTGGGYQVVLANINLHVLLDNMKAFETAMVPGGVLLLSGILEENRPVMTENLAQHGFAVETVLQKTKWLCIKAVKA
jgi:ribosomal protein L11 methyltransferase